jgi:hypothetical protein
MTLENLSLQVDGPSNVPADEPRTQTCLPRWRKGLGEVQTPKHCR